MRALVRSWIRVPLDVHTQRPLMDELLAANVAREIAFFRMDDDVMVEQRFGTESFGAVRTRELQIDAMRCLMSSMAAQGTQHFAAFIADVFRMLAPDVSLQRGLVAALSFTNGTEKVHGSQVPLQVTSTVELLHTFLEMENQSKIMIN